MITHEYYLETVQSNVQNWYFHMCITYSCIHTCTLSCTVPSRPKIVLIVAHSLTFGTVLSGPLSKGAYAYWKFVATLARPTNVLLREDDFRTGV